MTYIGKHISISLSETPSLQLQWESKLQIVVKRSSCTGNLGETSHFKKPSLLLKEPWKTSHFHRPSLKGFLEKLRTSRDPVSLDPLENLTLQETQSDKEPWKKTSPSKRTILRGSLEKPSRDPVWQGTLELPQTLNKLGVLVSREDNWHLVCISWNGV